MEEKQRIRQRIEELRTEWKSATPSYRKFIQASANVYKSKLQTLESKDKL